MKIKTYILTAMAACTALCFTSCSDDEPNGGQKVESGKYSLSGKVEKGPFVRGSAISVQPLNESMTGIGTVFNGEIKDDAGSFDLGKIEIASQLVRIATDGYYFNEVKGELSTGQLHLIALADISDKSTVNVNILTHLKSARIQKLVESGKNFTEANEQAQKELLTQFGLQAYENQSAETLSITSGNDGAGVLIVVSSLLLCNRSDAEITQYLSALSQDLADDGNFSESNCKKVSEDSEYIRDNVESIATNIVRRYEELGITVTIPDLRYFFDWDGDGIAGNELNPNPQITLSQDEINFGKDGGEATITIDANFKYAFVPSDPSSVIPDQFDSFFSGPVPLSVETSVNGNKLTIKGGVNKANVKRRHTINIYNIFDEVMAKITVNFEANPDYGLELSDYGAKVIASVMSKLTGAHDIYSTSMHEYCVGSTHRLDPYDYKLNEMYDNFYSVVGQVNNISRYLSETSYPEYAKLIQTYNAIVYTEMMEVWGDMPLIKFTDDPMEYHQRSGMNEIRTYFISLLKDALPFASNEKVPGSNEHDYNITLGTGGNGSRFNAGSNLANILFFLSRDILYLALGDLYLQGGQYSEAYSNYEKAVRNYAMSNSINFDRNNSELIFSPNQINLGGNSSRSSVRSRSFSFSVSTWPLYFLSDIRLRMAECQLKLNNTSDAQSIINDIKDHHSEFDYVSGSALEQIDLLHRDWYHPAYLGFLKRSGFGISKYGFENYQLLCPIPGQQISLDPNLTQNPGY